MQVGWTTVALVREADDNCLGNKPVLGADRACGGAHQLGNAGIGGSVGVQPDDLLIGLDSIPTAVQLAVTEKNNSVLEVGCLWFFLKQCWMKTRSRIDGMGHSTG